MNDYYPWTLTIINSTGELAVPVREAERAYDALRAEVERLTTRESGLLAVVDMLKCVNASDLRLLRATEAGNDATALENERLRGLIAQVERAGVHNGDDACPWCVGTNKHTSDCPAFSARGEVRR